MQNDQELDSLIWADNIGHHTETTRLELAKFLLKRLGDRLALPLEISAIGQHESAILLDFRSLSNSSETYFHVGGRFAIDWTSCRYVVSSCLIYPFVCKKRVIVDGTYNHLVSDYVQSDDLKGEWTSPYWVMDEYGEFKGVTYENWFGGSIS